MGSEMISKVYQLSELDTSGFAVALPRRNHQKLQDMINEWQERMDALNGMLQKERQESQMTLGELIAALEELEESERVSPGISTAHSYRGYYCDLAFDSHATSLSAGDTLDILRGCMGKVFEGYKGGEFLMGEDTPVWLADYAASGERIMRIDEHTNSMVTCPEEY